MKNIRTRNVISAAANILTAALVAAAVGWFFTPVGLAEGIGNMKSGGTGCFCFFTIDSNILAALCSLIILPYNIKAIVSGRDEIPAWAAFLKFVGTAAVTVTFVVVLVFLGPILGYGTMFEGNCFHLHLTCPLLAIASFCFCERGTVFSKKQALFGAIPVLIYGTVYLTNVIFTGVWEDFYHFNIGGFWYVSFAVMLGVTYALSLFLCALHNGKQIQTRRKI